MVCVGGAMLAIVIILKLIQGLLWIFIKVLERFVSEPKPLSSPPTQPGDDKENVIDLHPREWKVIK
jgi:hypothetical protein